jgi:hypothetical protein
MVEHLPSKCLHWALVLISCTQKKKREINQKLQEQKQYHEWKAKQGWRTFRSRERITLEGKRMGKT